MRRPTLIRAFSHDAHFFKRGFSVIELSVAIVVFGILIAITVDATRGYQSGSRDSERSTDIEIITKNLERYYRTQSVATGPSYPATSVGASGLATIVNDADAIVAPRQTANSIVIASSSADQAPTISQYIYQPLNLDGSLCATAPCVRFKVYYRLEVTNSIKIQTSMRQQ